jgi:hypothetical protein
MFFPFSLWSSLIKSITLGTLWLPSFEATGFILWAKNQTNNKIMQAHRLPYNYLLVTQILTILCSNNVRAAQRTGTRGGWERKLQLVRGWERMPQVIPCRKKNCRSCQNVDFVMIFMIRKKSITLFYICYSFLYNIRYWDSKIQEKRKNRVHFF